MLWLLLRHSHSFHHVLGHHLSTIGLRCFLVCDCLGFRRWTSRSSRSFDFEHAHTGKEPKDDRGNIALGTPMHCATVGKFHHIAILDGPKLTGKNRIITACIAAKKQQCQTRKQRAPEKNGRQALPSSARMEALGEPNPDTRNTTDHGAYDREGLGRLPLAIRNGVRVDHASRGNLCPTGQRRLLGPRRRIIPYSIQSFVPGRLLRERNVLAPRDAQ